MLGFVAMAAGTLWFYLERNDLKPELRSVATYAAVITFVAAIMYYVMKDVVKFPGGEITAADIDATLPLRYIDWLITTPLLLVSFTLVVAMAGPLKKGMVTKLIIADIIMIVTGYLGEIGEPGSAQNYIFFIVSTVVAQPALGMVGVALGHILATAAGVLYFLWYLVRSQGRLTLHLKGFALQRALFS